MAGRSVTTISVAWLPAGASVLVTHIPKSNWAQKVTEHKILIPWAKLPADRHEATEAVLGLLQEAIRDGWSSVG